MIMYGLGCMDVRVHGWVSAWVCVCACGFSLYPHLHTHSHVDTYSCSRAYIFTRLCMIVPISIFVSSNLSV